MELNRRITIGGICTSTLRSGSYTLQSGPRRVQFRVGQCPSVDSTSRDARTGYRGISRIIVEELPLCKMLCNSCMFFTCRIIVMSLQLRQYFQLTALALFQTTNNVPIIISMITKIMV